MRSLFIFILTLSISALGAKNDSLKKLNDKLSNQTAKVHKITAEIKYLEKRLGKTNNSYLEKVKLIENLEKKIKIFKTDLEKSAKRISSDYLNSKKALNLYLLEVSDAENKEQLLHKTMYYEILAKKLTKLKKAQDKSNNLLDMINLYEQKLVQTKATEEEIYGLILDLENRKKEMSKSYINLLEKKNFLENEVDKVKAKKKAYAKVYKKKLKKVAMSGTIIPMILPIKKFLSVNKSKKGIMLKFNQMTPVVAPSSGKVAYTGELASYGNVILIDHGKDVRSVIFGDMKIQAKKGDIVKEDQILAYTLTDPGIKKSLYYEIRKKNVVQNTLNWLSKKSRKNLKI